jgi:COMPASS component SWD3
MNTSGKSFKIKSKKTNLRPTPLIKNENGNVLIKANTEEYQQPQSHKFLTKYETLKIDNYIFNSFEKKMIKKNTSVNVNSEILQTRISDDDNKILLSLMNGQLYFFNNKNTTKSFFHTIKENVPLTALMWKNNKRFFVGDTEGNFFEMEYSKEANKFETSFQMNDNDEDQIFSIDYEKSLEHIVYGGKNMTIKLYDDDQKKLIRMYEKGDSYQAGHTNRIFSVKFIEEQPNLFISAGWDGTMFLWDTRLSKAVDSVYGPMITGDSIDTKGNLILAGSYRDKNPLELYDLRTFKKLCDIEMKNALGETINYISSCQFGKNKNNSDYIIAGSCITNQVGIFKKDLIYKPDIIISKIKSSVYSVGFGKKENKFYFSTSDGKFNIYHYFNM